MSVATKNPFSLLVEDEDDARPPSPPASTPPTTHPSASAKRHRGGPAAHTGKYYPRGGARQSTDRDPPPSEDPIQDTKQRRFDGERRGRGRGQPRGRGRTFDRHSATGKTDSDKKIHNGWGGDDGVTEQKIEEAATSDTAAEISNLNDWAAPAADDWGAPSQDAPPEQSPEAEKQDNTRRRDRDQEEDDNTLTLDQYMAQQKEKESSLLPKLETRKVDQDTEAVTWDGATRLEKGQGETYFSGKAKSAPKARTEKKERVFIEIEAHFERPSRGRGRGDRGDGRNRGGRSRGGGGGGGRGRAPNDAAPVNVDDETAFPSLS